MLHHNANFPNLVIREAYLVFSPTVKSPVVFSKQTEAVSFAASVAGVVVEASQVRRLRHKENVSAEDAKEKIYVLKLEE